MRGEMEVVSVRNVYLPPVAWTDYQISQRHEGGKFVLKEDPLRGKVEWKIRTHA